MYKNSASLLLFSAISIVFVNSIYSQPYPITIYKSGFSDIEFTSDSKYVLTSGVFVPENNIDIRDFIVVIWDIETHDIFTKVTSGKGAIHFDLSKDNSLILLSALSEYEELYNFKTNQFIQQFGPIPKPNRFVSEILRMNNYDSKISPDNKSILTLGIDNKVSLWDVETGNKTYEFSNDACAIDISPDMKWIATGAVIWDYETKEIVHDFTRSPETDDFITNNCIFSHDSQWIILGQIDQRHAINKVTIHDVVSGKLIQTVEVFFNQISSLDISHDKKYLVIRDWDANSHIWDIEKQKHIYTLKSSIDESSTDAPIAKISPNGKYLLTSEPLDNGVSLWLMEDLLAQSSISNFELY